MKFFAVQDQTRCSDVVVTRSTGLVCDEARRRVCGELDARSEKVAEAVGTFSARRHPTAC
jgi:hypothetical protein